MVLWLDLPIRKDFFLLVKIPLLALAVIFLIYNTFKECLNN